MRVLVATGSSGGHIAPALGYIESLMRSSAQPRVVLLAPRHRLIESFGTPENIEQVFLPYIRLRLAFDRAAVIGIADLCRSFYISLILLLRFKPDVVVGFGTVHSVPVIILAWFFRVRTVIHEQNVICGRANLLLSKLADLVCVAFEESRACFRRSPECVLLTGNPLRLSMKQIDRRDAAEFFAFDAERNTLLVMGGSQGSRSLNQCAAGALCAMGKRGDLQVIHITGDADYEEVRRCYEHAQVRARVYPFLKEMQYALSSADLAVSRAGATTIQELISFRVPAVVVPYPFAGSHQLANARVLEKAGSAVIIKEEDLSIALLRETLEGILGEAGVVSRLRSCYQGIRSHDAAGALVRATLRS